ncbi:MAG TPA: ATP-binding protein, partial [Acidothermaceae bacterium]|nr:ATP-binding protein [Acidothermaceae bacterium]
MTQPALLHLPGTTVGTTQWKAETLQMVNWGGFHGYVSVPFAPGATLLTGGSGTGKSTLLDAYLAVMMPSDTPFNGASNDAAVGRARGVKQRNLLTYLRGKTDTARENGTGELRDQVLRGQDNATWGAVAMTFVDDKGAPFTALRTYYVPRGATTTGDVTTKIATIEARLDLRELEPLRGTGFDKRTLEARWPTLDVHPTYASFSTKLFSRLGIGANGDGVKALRLLARIQAGQQIPTVDGLYKTMVLETPATYAAADKAVEHFGALEGAYNEMLTAADKARTLARLPELWAEREDARAGEQLIDTFGAQREGDTPLQVWRLRAERQLLEKAVADNRAERRSVSQQLRGAQENEDQLELRRTEIQGQQREHGGDILEGLRQEVERLERTRTETAARRNRFDDRVAPLELTIATAEQFTAAQVAADKSMASFDDALADLDAEQKRVREDAWPLGEQRKQTDELIKSLRGRRSLVPPRMHEARIAMARAAGLTEADVPFVAELIDIAPDQQHWRDAAEAALYSIARVLLVDERHYDRLSMAIDPLPIRGRYHFDGVELVEHVDVSGGSGNISGKLIYKDSPFSAWVAQRLSQDGTDALCVDRPEQLRGHGLRITRSGQTRHGNRGAHGKNLSEPIIGFNNADRIADLEARLIDLDRQLGDLAR